MSISALPTPPLPHPLPPNQSGWWTVSRGRETRINHYILMSNSHFPNIFFSVQFHQNVTCYKTTLDLFIDYHSLLCTCSLQGHRQRGGGGGDGDMNPPPRFKVGGWWVQSSPQVLVTKKKKSLEIETENEISTFLALIIWKASSFKIVWFNNFYIKYILCF